MQVFRGFSGDLSELSMGLNCMDSSLLQSPSDGEMHLQDICHCTFVLVAVLPAMPVLRHAAAALQGLCQTCLLQAAAAAVGFRQYQTACTITVSTCSIPWTCSQACRPSQHASTHTLLAMTRTSCRLRSAKGACAGRTKEHPAISFPHPLMLLACKCT